MPLKKSDISLKMSDISLKNSDISLKKSDINFNNCIFSIVLFHRIIRGIIDKAIEFLFLLSIMSVCMSE